MSSAQRSARVARRAGEPRASVSPRTGAVHVSQVQRARMLRSAVQVVSERGYGQMSVARVTGRAGVSRRTFYELFENREGCFLAAFDEAVEEMAAVALTAYQAESAWRERLRSALAALLQFLDEQPGIGQLVIVEALGAGPRVLEHRARLIASLTAVLDGGRAGLAGRREPPPLTAEGVVGAVLSVVHARLSTRRTEPLAELLNPLMGMIVAPYLGARVAARELERSAPERTVRASGAEDPLADLNMRITYRTLMVLTVIGEQPGVSNRCIADAAGVADQGQMSRLLGRLEGLGLLANSVPSQPSGEPNAWHLTLHGEEVQRAIASRSALSKRQVNVIGEGL
jgi:AcrR family transcriptional regulator